MADVAREANVSAMTVSRVLNDKGEIAEATRRRVLEVVEELGFRPSRVARSLATDQTFTIGLVVPNITHSFFAEIAFSAETFAWEREYNILLCNTGEVLEREAAVLQLLEETRADGIIVCSARLPDDRLLPLLEKHRAVVMFHRPVPLELAGVVRMDDRGGTIDAVNHLLASGRQVIGYLGGATHSYANRERATGYAQALEAAGRPVNPCLQRHHESGDSALRCHEAYDLLSTHPEIDGLICFNDFIAIGAIHACRALGRRVPEDVAVIGCDNVLLAELVTPSLTTLDVSRHDIGAAMVEILLERIQGNLDQNEVVIQKKLIVRASAP